MREGWLLAGHGNALHGVRDVQHKRVQLAV